MLKAFLCATLCFGLTFALAQISLVKDISQLISADEQGSYPKYLISNGQNLFFSGQGAEGRELWMSDGTPSGTHIVKDIFPGMSSSNPTMLTNVNGLIFFLASDGVNGMQLWRSDGTSAGTFMIFKSDNIGDNNSVFSNLTAVGNKLFFSNRGKGGSGPYSIGISDGTVAGTYFLLENAIGLMDSITPLNIVEYLGTFYFTATNDLYGYELWKTDGTIQGTTLAVDVNSGTDASYPSSIIVFNGAMYFSAFSFSAGSELWKSDGTAAGTSMVSDIYSGTSSSNPSGFVSVGNVLFFKATNGTVNGLWKTDGSGVGTVPIKNIGINSIYGELNGNLLFTVMADGGGFASYYIQLWMSDGTDAGTMFVSQLSKSAPLLTYATPVKHNGMMYFVAPADPTSEVNVIHQIWKTDGTAGGTVKVTSLAYANPMGIPPYELTSYANKVFFSGMNNNNDELLATDGSINNIELITNHPAINGSSQISWITELNGQLIFSAGDENVGWELFRSDGTSNGTYALKDIWQGPPPNSSVPSYLYRWKNKIYFRASTPQYGDEPWITDGTTSGTTILSDLTPGATSTASNRIFFYANDDQYLYFVTYSDVYRLWRTDGTASGTTLIKSLDYYFDDLFFLNGALFFANNDGIWKSDGTTQNTTLFKALPNSYSQLACDGKNLFFKVANGGNEELWATDGSPSNVKKIGDFKSVFLSQMKSVDSNGRLYFIADDGVHGSELWKTDGTTGGTTMIKDIVPGISPSHIGTNIRSMIAYGGKVFFTCDDGMHGRELWVTDGTETGTSLFKDIFAGTGNGNPSQLFIYNDVIYFIAYDGTNYSLWKTNGISCGTLKVTNNSNVQVVAVSNSSTMNGKIFMSANDYVHGLELFGHDTSLDLPIPDVCKQIQTISFDTISQKTYGDPDFILSSTSDSGLSVSYESSDSTIATVSGNVVKILSAGVVQITASQSGNDIFRPATPVSKTLVIAEKSQTISFSAVADKTFGDGPFSLQASATSGMSVVFSSTSLGISISGSSVTIMEAGPVTIDAKQPGNTNFSVAPVQSQTFCVNPAKPSIVSTRPNSDEMLLKSSASSGNQWYKDGQIISGATNNTYQATMDGAYYVVVKAVTCESLPSDTKQMVITAVEEGDTWIKLYPNPTDKSLFIDAADMEKIESIKILDMNGRIVNTIMHPSKPIQLDMNFLTIGQYILEMECASKVYWGRFIRR